jgi:hypothetical protein
MDGWMDGWVEAEAELRIVYSNQKARLRWSDFKKSSF